MYTLSTIEGSRALEYSSKSTPSLLALGKRALATLAPTFQVESVILEGAIRELLSIGFPTTLKLAEVYANVR